jgi:hypothetical protein
MNAWTIYLIGALLTIGWRFPKMVQGTLMHQIDLVGVPASMADEALRKMRVSIWYKGLCTVLGEAVIWPVTLAVIAWIQTGIRPVVTGESVTPEIKRAYDAPLQRLADSSPDPAAMLEQQKRVLFALAPVLEKNLAGVHLYAVAAQLIGVARYKIKEMLAQCGMTDPDGASGPILRTMAEQMAQAPMDDGVLAEYLAAAEKPAP